MENQNTGLPRYTSQPPKKGAAKTNSYALVSLIMGIISFLFVCFPPLQLILGGLSVMFALLSKQNGSFEVTAMIGLGFGALSCIVSLIVFLYILNALELLKYDPEYISTMNRLFKQVEQAFEVSK